MKYVELKKYISLYIKSILYVWKSQKTSVSLMFIAIPLQSLMPSLTIYLTNLLIENLTKGVSERIYSILCVWGLSFLLSNISSPFLTAIQGKLTDYLTYKLNYDIMKKSKSIQTIDYFEDTIFYNDIQILSSESSWRPVNLLIFGTSVISNCILFISMLVLFYGFHPVIALLMILAILPQGIIAYKLQQQSFETLVSNSEDSRRLSYYSQALLSSETIKDIRLFNLYDFFLKKYTTVFEIIQSKNQKNRIKKLIVSAIFLVITTIISVSSFIYVIFEIKNGKLGIGSIMVFSTSMIYSSNAVVRLVTDSSMLYDTLLYMEKFFDFININSPTSDETSIEEFPNQIEEIEFKNVNFSYENNTTFALKNISFKVKKGEKIAIVGENGAGKTTLIKLFCHFYDLKSGDILINGNSINLYNPDIFRQNISAIFQDFSKFDLTLRENVSISNINQIYNDNRIIKTLNKSGFKQKITLDTVLGKKFKDSRELSGGQWQKIALARAFFSDASVLILDEPTSAIDARTEHFLFKKFIELTKSKTVFYITHRLSSVKQADKILVLRDGEINSYGNHEELIKNDSYYKELYTMQSSLYYDEL